MHSSPKSSLQSMHSNLDSRKVIAVKDELQVIKFETPSPKTLLFSTQLMSCFCRQSGVKLTLKKILVSLQTLAPFGTVRVLCRVGSWVSKNRALRMVPFCGCFSRSSRTSTLNSTNTHTLSDIFGKVLGTMPSH